MASLFRSHPPPRTILALRRGLAPFARRRAQISNRLQTLARALRNAHESAQKALQDCLALGMDIAPEAQARILKASVIR